MEVRIGEVGLVKLTVSHYSTIATGIRE